VRTQKGHDKNKLFALHAPELERIGKGTVGKPSEFGVKTAMVISHQTGLVVGARSFLGNPLDGKILSAVPEHAGNLPQDVPVESRWLWPTWD